MTLCHMRGFWDICFPFLATLLQHHNPSHSCLIAIIMAFDALTAPRPLLGKDGAEPGFWAHAAYENPWPRGSRNSHMSGSVLYQLHQNRLYREPALRPSKAKYNGTRFLKAVGDKTVNVQALLAQATGPQLKPGAECLPCQKHRGPFVSCVVVPGIFSECANCHWSQQSDRCSFNTSPPMSFVPRRKAEPTVIPTGFTDTDGVRTKLTGSFERHVLREVRPWHFVERLNRRIDEILEAKAAQASRPAGGEDQGPGGLGN
ncbi:hypothetical protein DTO012A7_1031 [Penicillium roqueforti]|nr:hypothetical protein CBS147372_4521 [Penicillium roqueforti]KAI3116683.1 hypothetical protein CBS147333_307 [Penicillium roqueforti]KAI3208601.1 hypothetical protein CBS147311_2130 [Penicillium roqueforti]KAI3245052.1 hypothetical protein DTO012A7_1031 [Penicillium roqueforti]KAI3271973.1 hypothetical protein CBS147308_4237 [Penicillium roqueforti]